MRYSLSIRHVEKMMAERGVVVDHATVHRSLIKFLPVLAAMFRQRKRAVVSNWRIDETYIQGRRRMVATGLHAPRSLKPPGPSFSCRGKERFEQRSGDSNLIRAAPPTCAGRPRHVMCRLGALLESLE